MKESMKLFNKCVFPKTDKEERLYNSEKLRKILNSVFEKHSDIINNLFDLIDDIPLMIVDKVMCDDNYILSICDDRNNEYERKDLFVELRNFISNTIVKRSIIVFVAQ